MYTLRLTNTETDEITENYYYYYAYNTVTTIFKDRVDTLLSFYVENYELELLGEDGACLAYANGKQEYGGLLWKLDEEDEDFGDWDWALLKEWTEDGISAPIPKPNIDIDFEELFDDFDIDDDYIEEWGGEFDEEDFDQETQGFSHRLFAEEEW